MALAKFTKLTSRSLTLNLDDVLKYLIYLVLTFYSVVCVHYLTEAQLKQFENVYVRLALIVVIVLSASWEPIVCLLLAIAFLMTHQKLQEMKKKQTNKKIDNLQETKNNKFNELKKNNKQLNEMINNVNVEKIVEPMKMKNTSPLKNKSQDEIDTHFNYLSKNNITDIASNFFNIEDSFDKLSGNLIN